MAICAALSLTATGLHAQSRFAYVITDNNKEGANWTSLRRMDMTTGSFSDILLEGSDYQQHSYDASTKKQMTTLFRSEQVGDAGNAIFATGAAAIALDTKHDRLFYTPMLVDQLRYIDLKTMKAYFINTSVFTGMGVKSADQGNIFTRMTIASDGNGYALTNDGTQLVKFGTGKDIQVELLGTLVDDPANKNISIHNSCSSFGGDMIADDADNLYIFSARNNVFRVNLETKVATHMGAVTGLPATYTSNGAAVTSNNQVILTSAVDAAGIFVVDLKTLKATAVPSPDAWKGSDLASSNLYQSGKTAQPIELIRANESNENHQVRLYPNPVSDHHLNLAFSKLQGNFMVQVTDMLGRSIAQTTVYVKGESQTSGVDLPAGTKAGLYLVKISDGNKKEIFSQKFMVE